MNASTLPTLLQRFFTDRLTAQLQASPNTIAGYRDTFRLLLRFASQRLNRTPTLLRIDDLDSGLVGDDVVDVLIAGEGNESLQDPCRCGERKSQAPADFQIAVKLIRQSGHFALPVPGHAGAMERKPS